MKLPEDVRALLERRFAGKRREWLAESNAGDAWPLEISLSPPSEEEAYRDLERVRAWIRAWQAWKGPGHISWTERRWRDLGSQLMPERLVLAGPGEVATWAGQDMRWKRTVARYTEFKDLWPTLEKVLLRYFDVLADYSDPEFTRLVGMMKWLASNPGSNLYPRQIPLAGLDSKWLEARKSLITDLMAAVQNDSESRDFYARCGLRPLPGLVRLRILDPGLRNNLGGLSDISALPQEIAKLSLPIEHLYIVENVQSGLAFPDIQGAVVFMGLGYSVDLLAAIAWMKGTRSFYWGDCDTHGFAILNRARSYLPDLQSVMMDEETLLAHKALWGAESEQHSARNLSNLTTEEHAVYGGLKEQRWGHNVRLEQERIAWNYATLRLSR